MKPSGALNDICLQIEDMEAFIEIEVKAATSVGQLNITPNDAFQTLWKERSLLSAYFFSTIKQGKPA